MIEVLPGYKDQLDELFHGSWLATRFHAVRGCVHDLLPQLALTPMTTAEIYEWSELRRVSPKGRRRVKAMIDRSLKWHAWYGNLKKEEVVRGGKPVMLYSYVGEFLHDPKVQADLARVRHA